MDLEELPFAKTARWWNSLLKRFIYGILPGKSRRKAPGLSNLRSYGAELPSDESTLLLEVVMHGLPTTNRINRSRTVPGPIGKNAGHAWQIA